MGETPKYLRRLIPLRERIHLEGWGAVIRLPIMALSAIADALVDIRGDMDHQAPYTQALEVMFAGLELYKNPDEWVLHAIKRHA
ncbi:hypothetical protein ACEPAG_8851 [Sanghuangporus baumii]